MKYSIIFALLFFSIQSCKLQDCKNLPTHYPSYKEARKVIIHTQFKIHENCNTSSSSWIRAAEYYSCDGTTGYFLFKTDKQWYIHANMPLDVWEGFKRATSRGRYYDKHIKHKYQFRP